MYKKKASGVIITLVLCLCGIVYLYPLFLCLISSFKTRGELAESVISFPKVWVADNYATAFEKAGYLQHFLNSILAMAMVISLTIVFGSMAAYTLARWTSKYAKWSLIYILCGIIVPFQLALVPLYKIMRDFHLSGTLLGYAMLFMVQCLPLSVFLWTSFIKTIPISMEESAKIDGCSLYMLYWKIVFPLLKAVTTTVIILVGNGIWNDFFYAMLFLPNPVTQTLPLSIYTFVGEYGNDWPQIFAMIILIAAPILIMYVFAQKNIISGMTSGAVKG